nr:DUF5783 family protein [Salinibaculum sp. KK48]
MAFSSIRCYVAWFNNLVSGMLRIERSEVLRAIDRHVLNESEPVYEGDGQFRVTLPDDIEERRQALPGDKETFDAVLTEFVDRIENELRQIFGFEE